MLLARMGWTTPNTDTCPTLDVLALVQLHPIPSNISDIWYLGVVAIKIGCNQQIVLLFQQLRKTPFPCSALIMAEFSAKNGEKRTVVLVTGGSGLVGKAIESIIQEECNDSETWIFASSKDGDLRSKEQTIAMFEKFKPTHCIHVSILVSKPPSIQFLTFNHRMPHIPSYLSLLHFIVHSWLPWLVVSLKIWSTKSNSTVRIFLSTTMWWNAVRISKLKS